MPLPTSQDVYDFLEGYGISASVVSTTWIEDVRDTEIVPHVEHLLGYELDSEQTITEYYSGNGSDILILNRKGITEITAIELVTGHDISGAISLSSIELLSGKGILKAKTGVPEYYDNRTFPKGKNNIKITYKIGEAYKSDIMMAAKMLMAIAVLAHISDMTGGGNLTVQGFNRNHGNMGRYSNIRKGLNKRVNNILGKYVSSVVGS